MLIMIILCESKEKKMSWKQRIWIDEGVEEDEEYCSKNVTLRMQIHSTQ